MFRKALKVVVELNFRAVSCPGVHLPAKHDIYLSMRFMGQCGQSECLPAIFPLLFQEKMTFEKIFRHAVDPGDIAVMLEYETVTIELVQLIPPVGDTLACFEEDARRFLFPEPKLVPSFSGVDRDVLMTRASHFPGIAPRLEFSTKTIIVECSADAEINIYPNVCMRPVMKRNRKRSSRPRTSSPQRNHPQNLGRACRERHSSTRSPSHISRSQSLSPQRAGNIQRLARLSLDSASPGPDDSQSMLASWPGASRPASPQRSAVFTNSSSPLTRSSSTVRYSPTGRRKSLSNGLMLASWPGASRPASPQRSAVFTNSSSPLTRSSSTVRYSPTGRRKSLSNGLQVGGVLEDESSSSETHDSLDYHQGPDPSRLWQSYREQARSQSRSHREWEEVHKRVRGLLTTPKAVRRLVYGATHSEIDKVLARRSISPGPP